MFMVMNVSIFDNIRVEGGQLSQSATAVGRKNLKDLIVGTKRHVLA